MTPVFWVILLTHAQAEWQVYRALLQRGVDCILPFEMGSSRRGRWAHGVARPLFPGYIFARLDAGLDTLRSATGVRDVLRVGGTPVFVGDQDAAKFRALAAQALENTLPRRADILHLRPGDTVRVPSGPFAGVPAIVTGVDKSGLVRAEIGQLRITFAAGVVRGSAKPAEIST